MLFVDRAQVERGDAVELLVEGRLSPVIVPLHGLAEVGDSVVVVMLQGEAEDGSDLPVRVVTLDDTADADFRSWAAPWAAGRSGTADA